MDPVILLLSLSGFWGKIQDGVAAVVVGTVGALATAGLALVNKKLGVANEQRATSTLVNGYIGQAANDPVINGRSVKEVLAEVESKLVREHGMPAEKAAVAVAAAQLENGLPTGRDAAATKMDDVLTGNRLPQPR